MPGKFPCCTWWLTIITPVALLGCSNGAEMGSRPVHSIAQPTERPETQSQESAWVTSEDGSVSLWLLPVETTFEESKPIWVVALLRNKSDKTLNILRPFGDDYRARAGGIELRGPKGKLKYTGDIPDYSLGSDSFANVASGKIICDTMELTVSDFAGSDEPGQYTIVYTYRVTKDDRPSAEKVGFQGIWVGEVKSLPIRVTKR